MTDWTPNPNVLSRPAYLSLAEQFVAAIESGAMPVGARLAPQRQLAFDLGLSVQTVSRAYGELIRRGLVSGEVGRGSFVLPAGAEASQPYLPRRQGELIDMSILKPVSDRMHGTILRDGLHWVADNMAPASALSFRPTTVMPIHQQVAADWLTRGGVPVDPDCVLFTDGATSATTVAVMTALSPGSTLAAANLTHHLLMPLCKYLGIHLEALAQDEHGLTPAALDQAARKNAVRAVFLQPSAINPRGTLVGLARRQELVDVARHHDLLIIESDVLNQLIEDRPPPFAALAPERVLHINGFTKYTMPGARAGLLVLPRRLTAAAANRHLVTNWMAPPVMVELITHWMTDGTIDDLIRWQRRALGERHAIAAQALAGIPFQAHPQSLHVWLELPPGLAEDDFVARARARGVAIASGHAFRISERDRRDAVRIAVGSTDTGEFRRGMHTVADLLHLALASEPALPMV